MNIAELNGTGIDNELASLEAEFEALNEFEDDGDPLGIILAYSGETDCW